MAVNYVTALKTTRMTAVKDAIDAGAAAGYLEICTAAYGTVLATIPLSDPCGSVSGDTLTFTVPATDTSADATGTAAIARIYDSNDTLVLNGLTVGTSGTDIVLTSTSIVATESVSITSASIQHAA